MSVRRERKYAMIRYLNAGYSLADAKRKTIVVATGASNEYISSKDKRDLLSLEGGLYRLTMTRDTSAKKIEERFRPRKGFKRREEAIASLMTGFTLQPPLDYTREQAIKGKGKPAKPRIGSSKGKIGKTTVTGADTTLLRLKDLFRTLRKLGNGKGGLSKKQRNAISKSIQASVEAVD